METLQDVIFKQAIGDGSVTVVDQSAISAMSAERLKNAPPPVDRRTPASVAHELELLSLNFTATELQRKEAEQLVVLLTGQLTKLQSGKRAYEKRQSNSDHSRALLARAAKKIAAVQHELNDPRMGANSNLDRLTRIAANRREQVENFKKARPFEGAPTNEEVLAQGREDAKFEALLADPTPKASQPSVGHTIELAA